MNKILNVVCPSCSVLNRIPEARLGDQPKCGKCRQGLITGKSVDLNANNFSAHIKRNDIPVLVDFWAPWCGPCKMMAPAFEQAASQLAPQVRLAKLNTETEQGIGAQYAIRSIPTMVLFKGGRELARQSGAMNAGGIVKWVRSQL